MSKWIIISFGWAVALAGCDDAQERRDCEAAMNTVGINTLDPPEDQEERSERVSRLKDAVFEWRSLVGTVETEQVREMGNELADKVEDRKRLLENAEFVQPAKVPPFPAVTDENPVDAPEGRTRFPAEATGEEIGDAEKLPASDIDRLRANAQAIELLVNDLEQWCAD